MYRGFPSTAPLCVHPRITLLPYSGRSGLRGELGSNPIDFEVTLGFALLNILTWDGMPSACSGGVIPGFAHRDLRRHPHCVPHAIADLQPRYVLVWFPACLRGRALFVGVESAVNILKSGCIAEDYFLDKNRRRSISDRTERFPVTWTGYDLQSLWLSTLVARYRSSSCGLLAGRKCGPIFAHRRPRRDNLRHFVLDCPPAWTQCFSYGRVRFFLNCLDRHCRYFSMTYRRDWPVRNHEQSSPDHPDRAYNLCWSLLFGVSLKLAGFGAPVASPEPS